MSEFVLLHGAFRGPWAWDRVRPLLASAGHRSIAVDLTGDDATLDSYIEVVDRATQGLDGVVLVGHSQGGFVARAASQHIADRIQRLVYLDAPVPSNGQCAFDFRPAGTEPPAVDRGDVIPPRPVEAGGGLSVDDAEWINQRLVGQAVAPSMDKVVLTDPVALALPETFVFFERTPAGYPSAITRAKLDDEGGHYTVFDAHHDAPVSAPQLVTDALLAGQAP